MAEKLNISPTKKRHQVRIVKKKNKKFKLQTHVDLAPVYCSIYSFASHKPDGLSLIKHLNSNFSQNWEPHKRRFSATFDTNDLL